jgi:hypothetical protein
MANETITTLEVLAEQRRQIFAEVRRLHRLTETARS